MQRQTWDGAGPGIFLIAAIFTVGCGSHFNNDTNTDRSDAAAISITDMSCRNKSNLTTAHGEYPATSAAFGDNITLEETAQLTALWKRQNKKRP